MGSVAICITTRNRPEPFKTTIEHIKKHTVSGYRLIVVDDESDDLYTDVDISDAYNCEGMFACRFKERAGIPKAKNRCLELAGDADHIFLLDDDCYPIRNGWELPYIQSDKEHLCFTFLPSFKKEHPYRYHALGNGCMMYMTKKVIDTIGGFDERFGMGKYEHVNFSRRVCNSGLIDHPFIDLLGSKTLLHAMDEHHEVKRSFTGREMNKLLQDNAVHFHKTVNSKEYIPYY